MKQVKEHKSRIVSIQAKESDALAKNRLRSLIYPEKKPNGKHISSRLEKDLNIVITPKKNYSNSIDLPVKLPEEKKIRIDIKAIDTKEKNKNLKTNVKIKAKKVTNSKIKKKRKEFRMITSTKPVEPATQKTASRISELLSLEDLITVTQIGDSRITAPTLIENNSIENLLKKFNLKKHPFNDSLDTSFFYRSENHESAIIKMLMSIENDISFGLICGKSGCGKTLLSQSILEKLPKNKYHTVLVPVTPGLSKTALLRILLSGFGYDSKEKTFRDTNEMIAVLNNCILESYKKGIKPVLLIDECHFLSSPALHILRTLSNIEAYNKKLLTCLLFAEETFLRRLNNPYNASIRSRIYLEVFLTPMSLEETKNYIHHRLMTAGGRNLELFSDETIETIYKKSKGIPRNINKECSNLLLDMYLAKK